MVNYVGDGDANTHTGTAFKDTLDGQGGADSLSGAGSHDSILGGTGDDVLFGGAGKDTLRGGLDNDLLNVTGDNDKDFAHGDDGSDIIYGNGLDQLEGGGGSDYFGLYLTNFTTDLNVDLSSLNSGGAIVFLGTTLNAFESGFILFGDGDDKVRAPNMSTVQTNGGGGNDTLIGGAISDFLIGGNAGTDDADVLRGGDGNDELNGGIGDVFDGGVGALDIFSIYLGSFSTDFDLDFTGIYAGGSHAVGHGIRIVNCERGSIQLGSGDDKVDVGSQTDPTGLYTVIVTGNGGNDTLIGRDGDDNLSGGLGNDVIRGGAGIDTANYQYDSAALTIDLNIIGFQNTGGAGMDSISGCERVNGGQSGDRIVGDAEGNVLIGYGGTDTLFGGIGDDTLNGGGDSATETDRLSGGAGKDIYDGGFGADFLIWTSAAHTAAGAADSITGLQAEDVIHLRDIDANTTAGGDQAFTVVGALSGVAGQLAVVYGGTNTEFQMDTDGDGLADAVIVAFGDHTSHTEYVL